MADEYVTKDELRDLERNMEKGFNNLSKEIQALGNDLKNKDSTILTEADKRYRKKEDMLTETKDVLDDPLVLEKCNQIVRRSLSAPETKVQLKYIYSEFLCEGRDNLTKWFNLLKMVGAGVALYLLYMFYGTQATIVQVLSQLPK